MARDAHQRRFTPLLVTLLIPWAGDARSRSSALVGGAGDRLLPWHRDQPSQHPAVNAAELALLPPARETAIADTGVPWSVIFSNRHVWLLSVQHTCLYGWWFYINWLPSYLRGARARA